MIEMKTATKKSNPEAYILSVLSSEDRLDAAFKIAREAFKKTNLTSEDIDKAIKSVKKDEILKRTSTWSI